MASSSRSTSKRSRARWKSPAPRRCSKRCKGAPTGAPASVEAALGGDPRTSGFPAPSRGERTSLSGWVDSTCSPISVLGPASGRACRAARLGCGRGEDDLVLPACFGDASARQRIGPFVFGMTGMTAYPDPGYVVPSCGGVESLPQIDVLHRLLVGGEPASALPPVDPLGDAVAQILAIAVEPHPAGALQSFQSCNRRRHLHAVVG